MDLVWRKRDKLEAFAKLLSSSTSKSEENNTFATKYLVLLGTPIGEKTKKWVKTIEEKSSIKIINLYSEGDIVQISDFFSNFLDVKEQLSAQILLM